MTVLAPPVAPEAPRPRRAVGLIAHLGWEGVLLLLAVVITAFLVVGHGIDVLGRNMWLNFASVGLLASALAVSVRLRSVNLAVAAQALLAGIVYAKLVTEAGWPSVVAGAVAVVLVLIFGLILGLVAGLTGAPGWAVSLAGIGIGESLTLGLTDAQGIIVRGAIINATWVAVVWSVVFVLGSIGGAVAFLSLFTGAPDGGPLRRLLRAITGFGVSSLLAGISGVVLISYLGFASPTGDGGRLLVAAGAVLLGGVSALTGRGGIAGTVLATLVLVLGNTALAILGVHSWIGYYLPAAIAILVGVVVGWGFDKLSGPVSPSVGPPSYA